MASTGPMFSEFSPQQETLLEHEATELLNPTGGLPEIDFMVKMGEHIYKQSKQYMKNKPDELVERDKCLEHFRTMYPKFSKSYPTTLRYMIQMKQFSSKAFEQYLRLIKGKPWKTNEQFVQSQVDYAVMLQRALNKHYNTKSLAKYREEVENSLKKEQKDFDAKRKKAEELVNAENTRIKESRRQHLMELLKSEEGRKQILELVAMQDEDPSLGENLRAMEDTKQREIDEKIKSALRDGPKSMIVDL